MKKLYFFLVSIYILFAVFVIYSGLQLPEHQPLTVGFIALLSALYVAPPLWFFAEYHFLGPKSDATPYNVDRFKYHQELASRVWAAVIAVTLAIIFRK
jgi:hypothetical protein